MECRSSLCVGRATTSNLSDQPQFLTPPPTVNNPPTSLTVVEEQLQLFPTPISGDHVVAAGGEERSSWPGVNGVSAGKNAKRDLEIAGGACGGVELCLDGKDLSALVVSHTFHSFLIFQRGESTCRGTGPIFLARPLFTLGDWTSFIFTNHSTHVSHITHAAHCSQPNLSNILI